MTPRRNHGLSELTWATLMCLAGFALLAFVPVVPWQATCWDETVARPYRPIYTELVSQWLSITHVYHWQFNDVIYLRVLPIFDGDRVFDRGDAILNAGKISDYLSRDYTVDGVLYPKPPAVRELEAAGDHGDTLEICKAAIEFSPLDPPVPASRR